MKVIKMTVETSYDVVVPVDNKAPIGPLDEENLKILKEAVSKDLNKNLDHGATVTKFEISAEVKEV